MRVERVSDKARNQKFKVKDERQDRSRWIKARKQEIERLNVEAPKRGNKEAQQQARQLEQQQKKETRAQEPTQAKGPAQSRNRNRRENE